METHHHEWILTNRLGGYALGTGNLINQRKYHGLLISSDKQFLRKHLVAGMEEKVEWRGEIIHLDSNNYSNCIHPEGFLYLVKPWLRPYPAFLYSALPHQNDILILKEVMMDEGSNTVLVKYTNLGHHKLHFELHPKYTMMDHHSINAPGSLDWEQINTGISTKDEVVSFQAERPATASKIYGAIVSGEVYDNRYVYYNVYYPWEVMSGYPGIGDQITLFELRFDLKVGKSNYVLFSDRPIDNAQHLIAGIEARYASLPKAFDFPLEADKDDTLLSKLDYNDSVLFKYREYLQVLEFALRDFIANDDIVAGYPYFGAWGRDTMFVLNALLHTNKDNEMVERVLRKYSRYIREGLIPNMLHESGRQQNYDTIDATLWYVILLYKLGKKQAKAMYWKEVIPLSEGILLNILHNNTFPFRIREDGLIDLKSDFAHATWMDVRIDGKAVTPRDGAPIEINALWYNALRSYQEMCCLAAHTNKDAFVPHHELLDLATRLKGVFDKYWTGDYLADRLIGDTPIHEIRPNALIALSLPWEIVSKDKMQMVFDRAYRELYTFYGIRSLSPVDAKFRKKYYGTQRDRDLAYHNGSVWAWLLGAFCGLYLKLHRGVKADPEIATELSKFVSSFRNSFMRGHIASVAEVWDGDSPHFPKGAPAQAWSVAALYNIESFIAAHEEPSL